MTDTDWTPLAVAREGVLEGRPTEDRTGLEVGHRNFGSNAVRDRFRLDASSLSRMAELVRPALSDFEPLSEENRGRECALCRCDAVVELFGFRVCGYHATTSEDGPDCVVCVTMGVLFDRRPTLADAVLEREAELELLSCGCPVQIVRDEGHQEGCVEHARKAAARELLDAAQTAGHAGSSDRWGKAVERFLEVVGYRKGDRVYVSTSFERGEEGDARFGKVATIDGYGAGAMDGHYLVRFDEADPESDPAVVPPRWLRPIVAELLTAAGEVLDEEPVRDPSASTSTCSRCGESVQRVGSLGWASTSTGGFECRSGDAGLERPKHVVEAGS